MKSYSDVCKECANNLKDWAIHNFEMKEKKKKKYDSIKKTVINLSDEAKELLNKL